MVTSGAALAVLPPRPKPHDLPRRRNPALTKERILDAATDEFTLNGLEGAHIDAIAERAGVNKRMLYHYFGNKEGLFQAVVERAYEKALSGEAALDLLRKKPEAALREMVRFTFRYLVDNPGLIRLLNDENLYQAIHIRNSPKIRDVHSPMVNQLGWVLEKGVSSGVFRRRVDPLQLYLTIVGLGYYYLSNAPTLNAIFGRRMTSEAALDARLAHITEVVMRFVRP